MDRDDFARGRFNLEQGQERIVLQDRQPASPSADPVTPASSFGRGSSFDYGRAEDFRSGPFHSYFPGQNPLQNVEVLDEVYRKEKRIRIEGTGGLYVDIMRVEEIGFKVMAIGPGGQQYQKFVLLRMRNMPDTE